MDLMQKNCRYFVEILDGIFIGVLVNELLAKNGDKKSAVICVSGCQ